MNRNRHFSEKMLQPGTTFITNCAAHLSNTIKKEESTELIHSDAAAFHQNKTLFSCIGGRRSIGAFTLVRGENNWIFVALVPISADAAARRVKQGGAAKKAAAAIQKGGAINKRSVQQLTATLAFRRPAAGFRFLGSCEKFPQPRRKTTLMRLDFS